MKIRPQHFCEWKMYFPTGITIQEVTVFCVCPENRRALGCGVMLC
jgi:hypothetical protein